MRRNGTQALALLIYGGLVEVASWIANAKDVSAQFSEGVIALDLLLSGIQAKPPAEQAEGR
ncbi:hypothetical protein [Pseudomonas sp. TH49]|uniref:hypothetical protein n=1 Tax=Pseudomonas sp. TH49 TaxID=2796413 RepID=UPI00406BEDE3